MTGPNDTTSTATSDRLASCRRSDEIRYDTFKACPVGSNIWIDARDLTTLTEKEMELLDNANKYRLAIPEVSLTMRRGKEFFVLNNGWQLFCSNVDQSVYAQERVSMVTRPSLADAVLEWKSVNEEVALMRLRLKKTTIIVIQVHGTSTEKGYAAFIDTALSTMDSAKKGFHRNNRRLQYPRWQRGPNMEWRDWMARWRESR